MGLEDKLKEGETRVRDGIKRGTGVDNFGVRLKHFIKEIPSDVAYAVILTGENLGYVAATGQLPDPELEVAMIGGTKVLNDYIVGEVIPNAFSKEKKSGGQVLGHYLKHDFVPDLIETAALTGIAAVAVQNTDLYNPVVTEGFAEGVREVGKVGLEVGAGALAVEVGSSFVLPFGIWVWNLIGKVGSWYDSKITGMRYKG